MTTEGSPTQGGQHTRPGKCLQPREDDTPGRGSASNPGRTASAASETCPTECLKRFNRTRQARALRSGRNFCLPVGESSEEVRCCWVVRFNRTMRLTAVRSTAPTAQSTAMPHSSRITDTESVASGRDLAYEPPTPRCHPPRPPFVFNNLDESDGRLSDSQVAQRSSSDPSSSKRGRS